MIGGSSFDSTPLIFVDFGPGSKQQPRAHDEMPEGGHLVPIGITN
jgi:hypothetical protein